MAKKPFRMSRSIFAPVALATLVAGCSTLPEPFALGEQRQLAQSDRAAAQTGVEPLTQALTLSEAVARGLKYNLDHRSRMMEQAIALGQADLSRYDMLPKLVAAAGYNERNNESIRRATDSVTGKPSLANPYISSEREHATADLGLSWNILDFGVSYFNAKQNGDRVLIAAERRRKAMHNLIQDVRSAYWRALSAQKLDGEIRGTIALAESALVDSRKAEDERLRNPMDALRYQRTLLENLRVLETIRQELSAARIELAALINLPPGTRITLAEPPAGELTPRFREIPIELMEESAVANNADLREHFYNVRVAVAETRKSLLRLFPGLSFSTARKHDDDSYVINQSWRESGAQLSMNLFNLLSAPTVLSLSEASEKLAAHKRMTLQMAVLAQVHLARQQYENAYLIYERSDAIWGVDQRIFEHSANREAAQTQSKLERISNNTAAIVSLLRRYQALSQVHAANGKLQATLGLEPRVDDLGAIGLEQLTAVVEQAMREWGRELAGEIPAGAGAATPALAPDAAASVAPAVIAKAAADPVSTRPSVFLASFSLPSRAPALVWTSEPASLTWVDTAAAAQVVAHGRLRLGAPNDGRREAVVEWTASDAEGRPLGAVRYVGEVSKPATNAEWRQLKREALAALAGLGFSQ
jgi:outer membrane protein TolC